MGPPAHRPFHRPARTYPAPVEGGELRVPPPPSPPAAPGSPLAQVLLPLLGSMGMLGFAMVSGQRRFMVMAGIMAGALVAAGVVGHSMRARRSRREAADRRHRYLEHLHGLEERLEAHAEGQRHHDRVMVPPAGELWSVVADGARIWERREGDGDFAVVRVGTGPVPAALRPVPTEEADPTRGPEPELADAARRLVEGTREVEGGALTVDLRRHGCVAVVGDGAAGRAVVRSMLVQLAVWCAPDDLRIVVAGRSGASREWGWAQALPHLEVDGGVRDAGDSAAVAERLEHLLRPRLAALEGGAASPEDRRRMSPHVVIVVDGYHPGVGPGALPLVDDCLSRAAMLSATFVCISADARLVPSAASITLSLGDRGLTIAEARPAALPSPRVTPEAADPEQCRMIGEALAPLRLQNRSGRATSIESPALADLLGGEPVSPGALRAPIGVTGDGRPLELDLREASEGGMGPHGLLIGATGSGKSELLRTLVLGLAARQDPEALALVLVDYKGGATFAELDRLPHSAGLVTNLERDPVLVNRILAALHGELDRRQRVLRGAGGVESVAQYRERRRSEPSLGPLPSLLVVVDEFGELVTAHPEFSDLFETIGRVGRSLGVHLLLSTQRMEEGRLRRLDGHLRYRLCLRTFTPEESMTVLGSRAAAELPPIPGVGYLKVDGTATAFKGARVAGGDGLGDEGVAEPWKADGRSPVSTLVEELARRSGRTRQVWTEPLAASVPLDELLPPAAATAPGPVAAAIGLLDDPRAQTVQRLTLDLEADGNLALVGGPRSGKSAALQSLVLALAAHHDPFDLQVYAIDLGGGGLALLDGLPHVGAVIGRGDHRGIARLIRRLTALVERRADAFRHHRVAGMDEYRLLRRRGAVEDAHGDTVVLVDNWAGFVADAPDDVVDQLCRLASSGPHYGIHLVAATGRWQDLRPAVRDGFGNRLELRLAEPLDSEIDRRRAAEIPPRVPGRGIARCARAVQVAFAGSPERITERIDDIARRWAGAPPAPLLQPLPDRVTLDEIPAGGSAALTLGVVEHGLEPWTVDLFGPDPHLVVLGDAESGKTNLLRAVARRLAGAPDPVRIALIDYRGDLTGEHVGGEVLGSAATPGEAANLSGRLLAMVGEPTPGRPRRRTVMLVDDYDLVAGASGNPLAALLDVLPRGRDLGLHVVLARRVGGVGRSAFEPVYQRIREMGTPGVVLSGDPAEGAVLGGAKAEIRPPGRGLWVARGTSVEVQVGLVDREAAAVHHLDRRAG